jgi:Ca-activated chloride channel family protein
MKFANPTFLLLVFALPLIALFLYWREKRRATLRVRFAAEHLHRFVVSRPSSARRIAAAILLLSGIAAAIVAGARPQWGYEDRRIVSAGIDLVIAVDVSKSMLAEDYKPNRLTRAKELLQNILWSLKGDRVGIVAFAGDGAIVCPLTSDYAMAKAALQGIDTSSVSKPGTDLGRAIDVALGALELAAQGDKVIVLLTDGEDHGGHAIEMAEKAAKAGVRIYCIGIGTTEGMPIPEEGSYKVDKQGRIVSTRLDFATLTKIAELTKGGAFKANPSGTAEIQPILTEIERMQHRAEQETVFRIYHERFPWFVGLALVLLIAEMFVFETCGKAEEEAA